jgi:pimeloyl-ACP methyl ester carboxylesterase
VTDPTLTGRYAAVDGGRLYYETAGDHDTRPVVLVHTAGSDGRQWRYVAPALAERGYYVVVPDLPGHGKSYPTDWESHDSIVQHAAAVWRLIDHLGLDRPAVGGCSVGGDTILSLTIDHADEVAAAVVMEGAGRTRGAQLGRLSHPHALPGWENVLEYSVVDAVGEDCPRGRRKELVWQHKGSHEVATNDLQGWADFDRMDELSCADCPVTLVRGAEDYFVQDDVFERTVERLPDVEPVVLDGVGHYPMMEAPETVTDLLAGFVDR